MSFTAAASGFVVFFLSVQVIQGWYDWDVTYTAPRICALKGSTVEIRCTYTYPSRMNGRYTRVEETLWFTKLKRNTPVDLRTDSQYSGRVQNHCENNICTLRISNLTESDSAEYKFRFTTNQEDGKYTGLPGVTLSVTDLKVQLDTYTSNSKRWLKCQSSCHQPYHLSYIWYKNGQIIQGEASHYYSASNNRADSYSCAVTGYEGFPSPAVCVTGQTCNRVTYTDRSICAFKGSSVDISCTYNTYNRYQYYGYITSQFWFRPERSPQWKNPSQPEDLSEDSQFAGRVQVLESEGGRSTLRISDLRESDSAEYQFKFQTGSFEWRSSLPGTTLTVTALQVQVIIVSVQYSYTQVELRCHSSCSPADRFSYVWFRNEETLTWLTTSSYKGRFSPGDAISCALKGHETYRSPSVYAPKMSTVSVSPSGQIVEGRLVTLNCSSDANPAANYTWYKKKENLDPKRVGEDPQLVFSSIQSSDSGDYSCAAENQLGRRTSGYISVDVKYAPKTSAVSASPSGKIMEGTSVTLRCNSDAKPAAKNSWFKKDQNVPHGREGIYQFTTVGNYYCKSENQYGWMNSSSLFIDVLYGPKNPSASVSPSGEIVEGHSVTLSCSSDANPAANYTWYKENQTLIQGPEGHYRFTSISSEDSGTYYCKSENQHGRINSSSLLIDVQYAPKLPSVSVSPSGQIVEGRSVTLNCSSDANPAANYTWYKEDEDSPKASGQIFNITEFRAEHSGKYYCEAQNRRGRLRSTLHQIVVAGSMKSVAAGSITVIFLAIIFLCAFLFIRRRRSWKQTTERPDNSAQLNMGPVSDSPSAAPQRSLAEEQGDLCYASVSFFKNQEDPLYSNIRTAQPNRHKNEEEEEDEDGVEYTVVNFTSACVSPQLTHQEVVDDSTALYSTVTKKPRV